MNAMPAPSPKVAQVGQPLPLQSQVQAQPSIEMSNGTGNCYMMMMYMHFMFGDYLLFENWLLCDGNTLGSTTICYCTTLPLYMY